MPAAPIGHRIRARRKTMGMTQTALAETLKISVSYVNLIEHDKRPIGGALLNRLARALDLDAGLLDGAAERRLLQELEEIAADPELADLPLDTADVRDLIARHESWARALIAMRRNARHDQGVIAALSDRLNHDPVLGGAVHDMLSAAAAIRSVADIFAETPELEPNARARFDAILQEEAARLSAVSQSLAGMFDASVTRRAGGGAGASASEEVDDFLFAAANHFPTLETLADRLGGGNMPTDAALHDLARSHCGLRVETVPPEDIGRGIRRWCEDSADGKTVRLVDGAPRASWRFELARRIIRLSGAEEIEAALDSAPGLVSDAAKARGRRALCAYGAAALLMPYTPFHTAAEALRYDIDALAMRFGVSAEQLCHRFTTLRREGAEGVPFAMLRANAAGHLTKRFPLPRLPIPRYGGACPLWALYGAMQTPDLRVRQVASFPNGDRFLFIARATRPVSNAFGTTQPAHALMLACDIVHAGRLVYSDGLDLAAGAPAQAVGSTCLLCPRVDCTHREEAAIR